VEEDQVVLLAKQDVEATVALEEQVATINKSVIAILNFGIY